MQKHTIQQLKHLFLQQSCIDAWTEYERQLRSRRAILWDYVVLTASNEEQAQVYRSELSYRLERGLLPGRTKYLVLPDPDGKRVGSGGATLNVLKAIAEKEQQDESNFFENLRILVIHSGGDSKRIPQYSACGKLFSPIPRTLPNGQPSTLFDEFMISTSLIPARLQEGMLVMSGDVLLLFNALQIDTQFNGAAAISMKEEVETGKNHGVFLGDDSEKVRRFLHKQSVESLREWGAVDGRNQVNLDTGAILLDSRMLQSLYSLISTNNVPDKEKFDRFVNEKVRISFYGDFLYPLAEDATLEEYQKETPEGDYSPELSVCREMLWEVLRQYRLKLLCLSPAEFIHFGTTAELRHMVAEAVEDYSFLGWQQVVSANVPDAVTSGGDYALHNVFMEKNVTVKPGAYIENSHLCEGVTVKEKAVVSGLHVPAGTVIPRETVYHGLKLKDGTFVVRVYGVQDNPKDILEKNGGFLGSTLSAFLLKWGVAPEEIWDGPDHSLWTAKLYPVCKSVEECMQYAKLLPALVRWNGPTIVEAGKDYDIDVAKVAKLRAGLKQWKSKKRLSLYESFNQADGSALIPWRERLGERVRVELFVTAMMNQVPVNDALKIFCNGIKESEKQLLLEKIEAGDYSLKMRLHYGLAIAGEKRLGVMERDDTESHMQKCFQALQQAITQSFKESKELTSKRYKGSMEWIDSVSENLTQKVKNDVVPKQVKDAVGNGNRNFRPQIQKEEVNVQLPVRVNWGGGWTDTPPHCNEKGGVVLNAAISLKGKLPVCVSVRRLKKYVVELESQDVGAHGIFTQMNEINDCSNPYDKFALHKAALIACGIIRAGDERELEQVLRELGGGFYLSTQVKGVPKGSGLGTSSILSVACAKGLYEFLGEPADDGVLYDVVLCMEQLMSTGGGWQDQVGGLVPGIKMITTRPGLCQRIQVDQVTIAPETVKELQDRFALIYTGQRRLARNLLRDVVGGYIGNRPESLDALQQMKRVAALMKFELEQGDVDAFAELLNRHWELSVQLDAGSTNTCIEQIFLSIEDMIDGRFIAGAGGGGFLQVILKKGITQDMLRERLHSIFQDSGVDVWECELIF